MRGEAGGNGQGTWQHGKNASPLIVKVPIGTVVRQLARDDSRRAKDEWEAEQEALADLTPEEKLAKMRDNRWVHYPRASEINAKRDAFKEAEYTFYQQEKERRYARRKRDLYEPIELDLDKEEMGPDNTDSPLGSRRREYIGHLVASGGSGGLGNPYFLSSDNRSPKFATRGQEGERITLSLELKLLADIGLVGMPNSGKSTLLRALTGGRVKTEIAGYAFTTLNPIVGVVRVAEDGTFEGGTAPGMVHEDTVVEDQRQRELMDRGQYAEALTRNQVAEDQENILVDDSGIPLGSGHRFDIAETFRFTIADNPGLISGASDNVGLGHSFLRAMERSLALVYVVDLSGPSPADELRVLREELEQYQPGMSAKARMVIANKADLLAGDGDPIEIEQAKEKLRSLERYVHEEMLIQTPGSPEQQTLEVIPISAKFSQNLSKVVTAMQRHVEDARMALQNTSKL